MTVSLRRRNRLRLAVCCSGHGTNLQAMLGAIARGTLHAEVALVLSDQPRAYALTRARRTRIPTAVIARARTTRQHVFEQRLHTALAAHRVQYIALAGFMRILSPAFVQRYRGHMLNVHPALLPSFPGAHAVRDALRYGVKLAGVTVHFVDAGVDTGPIILQESTPVERQDTEQTLRMKLHRIEHRLYPRALQLLAEGRITLRGRKVLIRQ